MAEKYNKNKLVLIFLLGFIFLFSGIFYFYIEKFETDEREKFSLNEDTKINFSVLPLETRNSLKLIAEKVEDKKERNKGLVEFNFLNKFNKNIITNSTLLVLKEEYQNNEEIRRNVVKMPEFLIGMDLARLKEVLIEWKIEEFKQDRFLILSRKVLNKNNDDFKYIIGINKGKVVIFSDKAKKEILQTTDIEVARLPESEKKSLENGIKVNSDEELFNILEGMLSYYQD